MEEPPAFFVAKRSWVERVEVMGGWGRERREKKDMVGAGVGWGAGVWLGRVRKGVGTGVGTGGKSWGRSDGTW